MRCMGMWWNVACADSSYLPPGNIWWINIYRGTTLTRQLDIMFAGEIHSVTHIPLRSVFQIAESGSSLHAVHPEKPFLTLHAGIIIEFHLLVITRLIRHQLYLYQYPSLHFKTLCWPASTINCSWPNYSIEVPLYFYFSWGSSMEVDPLGIPKTPVPGSAPKGHSLSMPCLDVACPSPAPAISKSAFIPVPSAEPDLVSDALFESLTFPNSMQTDPFVYCFGYSSHPCDLFIQFTSRNAEWRLGNRPELPESYRFLSCPNYNSSALLTPWCHYSIICASPLWKLQSCRGFFTSGKWSKAIILRSSQCPSRRLRRPTSSESQHWGYNCCCVLQKNHLNSSQHYLYYQMWGTHFSWWATLLSQDHLGERSRLCSQGLQRNPNLSHQFILSQCINFWQVENFRHVLFTLTTCRLMQLFRK